MCSDCNPVSLGTACHGDADARLFHFKLVAGCVSAEPGSPTSVNGKVVAPLEAATPAPCREVGTQRACQGVDVFRTNQFMSFSLLAATVLLLNGCGSSSSPTTPSSGSGTVGATVTITSAGVSPKD